MTLQWFRNIKKKPTFFFKNHVFSPVFLGTRDFSKSMVYIDIDYKCEKWGCIDGNHFFTLSDEVNSAGILAAAIFFYPMWQLFFQLLQMDYKGEKWGYVRSRITERIVTWELIFFGFRG